ncbi:MAG: hypothetical protein D6805_02530 [Planctomycetota bacterium]|nr:MAG: hypothetical protein D6805_02530 [Planctomycetota bacterium]
MKVGENFFGYLLLTPGAKSPNACVWKAVQLTEPLQEALRQNPWSTELSEEKITAHLNALLQTLTPSPTYCSLMLIENVAPEDASWFRAAYRQLRSIEHPHLTKILYSEYEPDTQRYILGTEYLHGRVLSRIVAQYLPQKDWNWAVKLAPKLLQTLAFCHQHKIIHGGLRPDSIVFLESGGFKVRGFGLLGLFGGPLSPKAPQGGGVLKFLPPELWKSGQEPDERSDIYSLGMIFYYCFCGSFPLQGTSPGEIFQELSDHHTPFPSLAEKNPQLPPPLVQAVDGMIQKDPNKRLSLNEALQLIHSLSPSASPKTTTSSPEKSFPKPEDNDTIVKTQHLRSQLIAQIQSQKSLEQQIQHQLVQIQQLQEALQDVLQKHQIILQYAQESVEQLKRLERIMEKNTLQEDPKRLLETSLSPLPSSPETLFIEQNNFSALVYPVQLDPFLKALTVEIEGEIHQENLPSLRAEFSQLATQNTPLFLLDFSRASAQDSVYLKELITGFLNAVASPSCNVLFYQAPPSLQQLPKDKSDFIFYLHSLQELSSYLQLYREKTIAILYPTKMKDFKQLPHLTQKIIKQGYRHLLVDLSKVKALRGDDMEGLLEFHHICQQQGAKCAISSATADMKTLFKIMNLETLQNSYPDAESAINDLKDQDNFSLFSVYEFG